MLTLLGCAVPGQGSLTQEQKQEINRINEQTRELEVETLLENKEYKIAIDRAYSVNLRKPFYENSEYFYLTVKGDYLECLLPYFGKVTNQPQIGRRSPLDFSSNNFIYSITYPSTGRNAPFAEVKIDVRSATTNIRYDIFVEIQKNGSTYINLTGPSIEAMQFSGEIKNIDYTK